MCVCACVLPTLFTFYWVGEEEEEDLRHWTDQEPVDKTEQGAMEDFCLLFSFVVHA